MSALDSNWQTRPLGELATTTSGGTPSRTRKDYYGGSIPWVKSGELNDDYIFKTEEHITEAGLKSSSAKLFPSGTVLIALYGATVGKTSILRIDASTNQAVCGITPGPELDGGYLRYHLISLRRELLSHRYGGAQPNISQQIVRNQKIAFPPLPEQKKIAHILSTVQRAIEAQERIIQTTTELKKALMHKLFTEGLRYEPQKQTEIGPVPESWEVVELETLFEKQPQNGIYKHKRDYGSGTQILRIDDFSNDGDVVTKAGNLVTLARREIETYGLEPGDIVINRVNSLSHLGKTALIGAIGDEMVFESNMMRFSVDESQVLKEYVFKFLNSPLTKKQIIGTAKRAVAQSSINQGDVKSIIVPKPPLEEQREIVAALDATEAKIAHSTDKAAVRRDLFRTLLHALMTAKTLVHELEIPEPAN